MAGKLKSVAVYCGHQFGNSPEFARDAEKIGTELAKNGIRIVFGGGNVGLMGTVASAALRAGGHVIGVSTHHVIALQEPAHEGIDVEIVDGVNERKQKMFEQADGFIILPGGTGTLNELTDIMTMQQIGETTKPLFFMNTNHFWAPFARLLIHMKDCGFFVRPEDYNMHSATTPEELLKKVLNY
ncbi:TIGR00730 family Rossman fold protein [bacterium]|nr:TIGR00730 family Rossman fold protein [bacterium]